MNDEPLLKSKLHIDSQNVERWISAEGLLHRENGPAVVDKANNLAAWFLFGTVIKCVIKRIKL